MTRLFPRSLAVVAAAVAFCAPIQLRAEDEPKDILAKAIKAHGGEKLLTKYKATELKRKGKLDIAGVGEVPFTQETSYMLPDKFRDSMELTVAGQTVSIFTLINGDKITVEVNGKAINAGDKVKEAMKDVGLIVAAARLVPLKDKKYELSTIGDEKVEGKATTGIRVSAKDQKDVSLYFYKDSGMLAKIEYRAVDQATSNEVNEERIILEYKKTKEGLATAKKILIKRDGKKYLEAEVTSAEMFEKLDDSVFKK